MSTREPYKTPAEFRRALTDKLKELAKTSRWGLSYLQRQMAYDRLLERLYMVDDRWIVKGAVALLARNLATRASVDVDVYREGQCDVIEGELRDAAVRDLGDWFRFNTGPSQPVRDAGAAMRIPVTASIGTAAWASFHVDLVGTDVRMTGQPEDVPAIARVAIPDVEQHGYRVYPLVDHIADKVAATFERYGERENPSTRYHDLVDLVSITMGATVSADNQMVALASEANRRGITLPQRFEVPDRALWERGYAAEAGRSLLPVAHTLDDALGVVQPFLDPLLDGSARGSWDPVGHVWAN